MIKKIPKEIPQKEAIDSFPISILRNSQLSSLEAIVKYLRENKALSYEEIGKLLSRKPKTLAVTYACANRKFPKRFSSDIASENERIEFSAFKSRLSVLESICIYLRSQNKNYSQIALMLSKDPRTVWTVCKRAEKKIAASSANNQKPNNNDVGETNG